MSYEFSKFEFSTKDFNIKINISRIGGARELELSRKLIIYEGLLGI